MSAALKAAQLDSPTDGSPTEAQPELEPENNTDGLSAESEAVEVESETQGSSTEEEQTLTTPAASEPCPVLEQGDEETQTEPLENQEPSPPNSPILVQTCSDLLLDASSFSTAIIKGYSLN